MAGETMSWADMSQFVNWSPDEGGSSGSSEGPTIQDGPYGPEEVDENGHTHGC